MNKPFSNIEIVTLAVYLLGGDSKYVDIEDVAIKANELAPGRFSWRKYPDQININSVGKRLSDAKNPRKAGYLLGSYKQGWMLSESGLSFSRIRKNDLRGIDLSRSPLNKRDMLWKRREKERMLASVAYEKLISDGPDNVTIQEAEAFFRVDDYVTGTAREKKLVRIMNVFGDDPDFGQFLKTLEGKVRKK